MKQLASSLFLVYALMMATIMMSSCGKESQSEEKENSGEEFIPDDGLTGSGQAWHVAVNGTPQGNGAADAPWNLQTALNHPAAVKAGDVIWIHGGTYTGVFTSNLAGSADKPIIVRAVGGVEVILNGDGTAAEAVLTFTGSNTWIAGLTIQCDQKNRNAASVNGKDGVFFTKSANNKLINCTIRNNGGNGIGFWSDAINAEIYGCIIYHNGYIDSDRGHGHGIYTQNETGTKHIGDNIMFNSFGIGIQIYTEKGSTKGYEINGNMIFNSGLPGANQLERNIICGGLQEISNVSLTYNYFYFRPNYPSKASVQFGYSADNDNAVFSNNYMVDGTFYIIKKWQTVTAKNNTIIARNAVITLVASDDFSDVTNPQIDNNTYNKGCFSYKLPPALNFQDWQNQSHQDAASTYDNDLPAASVAFVRPNKYVKGRAHIAVYNWANSGSVSADVSKVLSVGDKYALYDVSNLAGGAIATGTYAGGSIVLPMNLTAVELPAGWNGSTERFINTTPQFGVFILEKVEK